MSTGTLITGFIAIFILAILGAAFTGPLSGQLNNWSGNLSTYGYGGAAAVVSQLGLIFWTLAAVGVIILIVRWFLPGKGGL